jgi:uncharacterized heparinase superfamily protein
MSTGVQTSKPALYWHTLRFLRPVQIFGRLWFRLYRPRPDLSPPPPLRQPTGPWVQPPAREPSLVAPRSLHFLSVTRSLDDIGWDNPQVDKLWRYNQHYFEDLNACDADSRRDWHAALLADWLRANPPGQGSGWEPYPLSLRLVNWIKYHLAGHPLPADCQHSLAVQARWLERRIEWHLLGNHLLANAKALVFAGCFFSGPEAERWLQSGLRILENQLAEQILPDGGHFELSPMYHALVLEDLLDLVNLLRHYGMDSQLQQLDLGRRSRMMLDWLATMSHPDGDIAFFNDAAFGIAATPGELVGYAQGLGLPLRTEEAPTHLADSGYLRLGNGAAVLLLDVARVGPDYQCGHAHADSLSFEFSLFGQRVLVNSGTSVYGTGDERQRQRGSAAHNCLVVAGRDSSEVWHGFRVARRARPFALEYDPEERRVACSHDGYRQLLRPPCVHRREWCLRQQQLEIHDRLQPASHPARAYFHLHPALRVLASASDTQVQLQLPQGQLLRFQAHQGRLALEPASWHPYFGRCEASHRIVVDSEAGGVSVVLDWS